jgi:transposase-like protein
MSAFRTKEREASTVSVKGTYRPRRPRTSPLWRCLGAHFDEFLALYPERYEARLGFLRPVIKHVVEKFLACGDLTQGFARIRCPQCRQEYLLAFSCRGRGFCPSCHQKRVLLFGERISKRVAARVPHRHYVFAIPIMLRAYFRYNRALLHLLCAAAERSLRDQASTADEQVFPDYDQYDPGPVYA